MGGGASVTDAPPEYGTYKRDSLSRVTSVRRQATVKIYRRGKKSPIEFSFVPEAFLAWMEGVAFFRSPGILHQAANMRKKYRRCRGSKIPIEDLCASFREWDDIHFYGLIAELDPVFAKSEVLDLEYNEAKSARIERKAKKHAYVDPELEADFLRALKMVLLFREDQRTAKGKGPKLTFEATRRFGGQDINDLKEELYEMAEFPDEYDELKTRCSELIQRLSESYLEQQTLQDNLTLKSMEHENELVELKDDLERKTQKQLQSLDERYGSELEDRENAYQKMVNKYSKMKLKYKNTKKKNKFLHQNNSLGMFAKDSGRGASPDDWKHKLMMQLSEREEEILELQNQVYEYKRKGGGGNGGDAKSKKGGRRGGDDDMGDVGIGMIDDSASMSDVKEAMKELARARDRLSKSLEDSRAKVSELEEKCAELDKNKRAKERQLMRDNATMMRQVLKLRTALQGADVAIPVTARSSRGAHSSIAAALKDSKRITKMMEETRKAMDGDDSDPVKQRLRQEASALKKQVEWLARQVCRYRQMGRGAVCWIRHVMTKRLKAIAGGTKKAGGYLKRSAAARKKAREGKGRGDAVGKKDIDSLNSTMQEMFQKQQEEIKRMLAAVKVPKSARGRKPVPSGNDKALKTENKRLAERVRELEGRTISPEAAEKHRNELKAKTDEVLRLRKELREFASAQELSKASAGEGEEKLQARIKVLMSEVNAGKDTAEKLVEENRSLKEEIVRLKARIKELEDEQAKSADEFVAKLEEAKASMAEMTDKIRTEMAGKLEESDQRLREEKARYARLEANQEREMKAYVAKKSAELREEMEAKVAIIEAKMIKAQEAFKEERILRIKYHNMVEDMKGKIRVYCRIRPMSRTEKKRGDEMCTIGEDQFSISVTRIARNREVRKEFSFDEVFPPSAPQEIVYENTSKLIQSAYDGYNVCIFAYGQTGTGKTYTMYGEKGNEGIAPRAIHTLYDHVRAGSHSYDSTITCYMVELYKSNLQDLLDSRPKAQRRKRKKLKISKNVQGTIEVHGCEIREAKTPEELLKILDDGNKVRVTSSTKMNAGSSRSHLILSILVKNINRRTGVSTVGKLSLVDLAGCERAAKTGATAEQLKEAQSINQSLSALGNVIAALSTGSKHVPYRSHVLTNLMSDSLGGNAKTLMFVNVSPSSYNADETINALNYATRVKMVKNTANKTIQSKAMQEQAAMIAKLQAKLSS